MTNLDDSNDAARFDPPSITDGILASWSGPASPLEREAGADPISGEACMPPPARKGFAVGALVSLSLVVLVSGGVLIWSLVGG